MAAADSLLQALVLGELLRLEIDHDQGITERKQEKEEKTKKHESKEILL